MTFVVSYNILSVVSNKGGDDYWLTKVELNTLGNGEKNLNNSNVSLKRRENGSIRRKDSIARKNESRMV